MTALLETAAVCCNSELTERSQSIFIAVKKQLFADKFHVVYGVTFFGFTNRAVYFQ